MRTLFGMVLSLAAALCVASPASAQFVGDVFFAAPSIAVPAGESGDLDLAIFTGDKPFGAAIVTLAYDPAKVEIVSVTPGSNGGDNVRLESSVESGTIRIVALNGTSLQQPIGSVAIARVRVRPIGASGDRVVLRSAVSKALFADRSAMRAGTGFDGEIVIGQKSASATATVLAAEGSALAVRARRLRPAGSEVGVVTRLSDGRLGEVHVRTAATAAARER